MSKRITKIIILSLILIVAIGTAIGVYILSTRGPIIGRIEFGTRYTLKEIRTTDRFAGATMSTDSYFVINTNKKTGSLYLKDLTATTSGGITTPISFIVTNYKETTSGTIIDFEYIISNGNDTIIQSLQAISNNTEIRIKTVESHEVSNIIAQNPHKVNPVDPLEYEVTILVFSKEAA